MSKVSYKDLLKNNLTSHEFETVMSCSETAFEYGFKIYLIGGVVRDLILGAKTKDIDITVEGDAADFVNVLQKKIPVESVKFNKNLPTAKVRFENGTEIDFASTRSEIYPKSGDLPVIVKTGTSLKEDVLRRDFTVNALALSLSNPEKVELIDYTGGFDDLKNRQIRVLHEKSFYDDPSRLIRALKFSLRYGFKPEKGTLELQKQYLENPLKNIPLKRVKDEITETFGNLGCVSYDEFIKQKLYKIFFDNLSVRISGKDIQVLISEFETNDEDISLMYFLPLFFAQNIPEKLNLTNREISVINSVNRFLKDKPEFSSDIEIKEYFDGKDYLVCFFYGLLTDKNTAVKYFSELSKVNLLINGKDLKELGVKEGKIYGELLKQVLAKKIEKGFKTKQEEINYLKKLLTDLKNQ